MNYDNTNIFAKILRGEIPCERVYENDQVLAFRDIQPRALVHVLVIPKKAYTCFTNFSAKATTSEIAQFFQTVSTIAAELGLVDKGFRLVMNTGAESGNMVPHFHVHILGGEQLGCISGI